MKRVCCFCESWESGGIESFLCNILLHMDLSGLEVDIVAARLEESVFTEPLKVRGIRFYELSGKANETLRNHRAFRRLLKERKYDVLHLNIYQSLSLAYARLARNAGVPVRIAHGHNTALRRSPTRRLKLALHHWAGKKYGGDVTHRWACSAMAAEFMFGSAADFTFIPNGINTERFRFDPDTRTRIRKELGVENALVVGNVGRLCYQKNQSFALDVFQILHQRQPESVLLLVGEGEDRKALEEKAKALGIEDSVIFCGITDRVEQLYWAMDVFLFPSRFEGLGIVAIEAQAAGLPVLCSENIPREALITEWAARLKLSDGPRVWAEKTLALKGIDREGSTDKVAAAGFDIRTVAERIRKSGWGEGYGSSKDIGHRPGVQGGALSAEVPGQHSEPDLSKFGDPSGGRRLPGQLRGHL